jgi:hypothetical protein
VVKADSSTIELPLILQILSIDDVGGICGVAVKCLDMSRRTPIAKAADKTIIDAEARKCGDQTGLDTLVVRTVNDDN